MSTKNEAGFTLVELMVSIGIVAVLTSVVFFRYGDFTDKATLNSAAQNIALTIRQAQIYGVNVNQTGIGSGDFSKAFGIYVNPSCTTNIYYLFVDGNANEKYDFQNGATGGCGNADVAENGDVLVGKENLTVGVIVSDVCTDSGFCSSNTGGIKRINMTFLRPNTDANIRLADNNSINWGGLRDVGYIVLLSPAGNTKTIMIERTGQISIQ